ncbi:MAG: hypothetical protein ABW164_07145 [Sphingobium sp.]
MSEGKTMPSQADLAKQTPEQIIASADSAHPASLYILASKLMHGGRFDEAVRWFYIGQLRYRFYLMTDPQNVADERILFSALSESVGRPINEYAFGNVDDAVREIDAALAWDADHPNYFTDKDAFPQQLVKVRDGLKAMRDDMLARKDEIRETRTRNGLPNR